MKIQILTLIASAALLTGAAAGQQAERVTRYVDPYIGTTGFGCIFLAANVPFGYTQVGPTEYSRPPGGGEWTSGYNYSDSILIGFGHLHLSGTGCGDLGDVSLLPTWDGRMREVRFRHDEETVRPGYYAINMRQTGIKAEMTATCHTGFHRYTFPNTRDTAKVILNLRQGVGYDRVTDCSVNQESETVISGFRFSTGWTKGERQYYTMKFSAPIIKREMKEDSIAVLSFRIKDAQPLLIKVALSGVSIDGAKLNLSAELPGWDFDAVAQKADDLWCEQLSKVRVKTSDTRSRRIFYSSLFHTMVCPSVYSDVNGDYRGVDGKIHHDPSFTNYTTFSFWDTARGVHPLATLIHPDKQADWAKVILNSYDQIGVMPFWQLMGCELFSMGRCYSVSVLSDMICKGFPVDTQKAGDAIRHTRFAVSPQNQEILEKYGYFPHDKTNERCSDGLDLAVVAGDALLAAKKLGRTQDYAFFERLSQGYRKYFDPKTRFMRAVNTDGSFLEPFDPCLAPQRGSQYAEGNSWMWTWHVMHDPHGLISLMGGDKPFCQKLDSLFIVEGGFGKPNTVNHTGVIGNFYQGNEHCNHVPYLYSYAGQPWKSAYWVRQTMDRLYTDQPDGICGNDDAGQLSSWYVLSAMGFYQVNPAGGVFVLGSPVFDEAAINVGSGKTFTVRARGASAKSIYIQSARLNGKPYTRSYILYADIARGGTLDLVMGPRPSKTFGVKPADRP